MKLPEIVLVIAYSARMAAQLVNRAGVKALVIDCFADTDTQAIAVEYSRVTSLDWLVLEPAINAFTARYAVSDVLYGAGFEDYPDSLKQLHSRFTLLGNSPDVFEKLADKPAFFAMLNDLSIPYPPTQFTPPVPPAHDWLVKPQRGHGGKGIDFYSQGYSIKVGDYYQKLIRGTVHSVLFLADGQNYHVIGYNQQFSVALSADQPFAFAFVCNCRNFKQAHRDTINEWLYRIIKALSIKGVNTIDFIVEGNQLFLLEINTRLSASMQIYNADWFDLHFAALHGVLPVSDFNSEGNTAYKIIYAFHDVQVPAGFSWPAPCYDVPPDGTHIDKGQPICSMIVHQNDSGLVMQTLQSLETQILQGLYDGTHR